MHLQPEIDEESCAASDHLLGPECPETPAKKGRVNKRSILGAYLVLLHVLLFTLAFVHQKSSVEVKRPDPVTEQTWSPLRPFIDYEVRNRPTFLHRTGHERFQGWPTNEQDKAWDYLVRPTYFNATCEELEKSGESLEDLAELKGGGYLSTLGVYHEIHCLRQIRFFLFKDRYYPNAVDTDIVILRDHLDHCVEVLRDSVMCHGNMAMSSFHWESPDAPEPVMWSNAKTVCAKWESIEEWAYSRAIDFRMEDLMPPK